MAAKKSKNQVASPLEATRAAPPRLAVLGAAIATYVVLTFALLRVVPIGNAPDETQHFEYVSYLATNHALPVFERTGGNSAGGYEFHQPPLYYLVCAPLWQLGGPAVQQHLCRVVSLLCGALTLVLLWYAVARLFPGRPDMVHVATMFTALWPLHQNVGAVAGNDAMAGLIAAGVFYGIVRLIDATMPAARRREALLLGGLLGLGVLTKTTCAVLLLPALAALWFVRAPDGEVPPSRSFDRVLPVLVLGAAMLLIGGPWLLRNHLLYGDPFALGAFNERFAHNASNTSQLFGDDFNSTELLYYSRAVVLITFCTAWGIFAGPNTAFNVIQPFGLKRPDIAILWALPAMLVCALGTGFAGVGLVRWQAQFRTLPPPVRVALRCWGFGGALIVLLWLQFTTHYFQAQARYFHAALLPLALGATIGWQHMLCPIPGSGTVRGRIANAIIVVTLVGLTLWNVFGWQRLT